MNSSLRILQLHAWIEKTQMKIKPTQLKKETHEKHTKKIQKTQ